jgi:ketosteroid isomerase-like protein
VSDPEGADLDRIERDRLRALVDCDFGRAAPLHADDFQLITPAGRILSKEEYLEAVRSRDIAYAAWDAGEIRVRRYGDVAVLRYASEIAFTVDGAPTPRGRYRHTDLYERRDGRWQVVWSQATRIEG